MIRRSFRIGLRLGLLAGIVAAVVKAVQSRRPSPPAPAATPWTPAPAAPPSTKPAPAEPAPAKAATAKPAPSAKPESARPESARPKPPPVTPDVEPEPGLLRASTESEKVDGEPAVEIPPSTDGDRPPAGKPQSGPPPAKKAPAKKAAKKAPTKKATKKSAAKKTEAAGQAWVEPSGGVCPPSHPIKAKLSSKIFHLPGMLAYDRTKPDRCYRNEDGATGDGLTKAKR